MRRGDFFGAAEFFFFLIATIFPRFLEVLFLLAVWRTRFDFNIFGSFLLQVTTEVDFLFLARGCLTTSWKQRETSTDGRATALLVRQEDLLHPATHYCLGWGGTIVLIFLGDRLHSF